jgi:hypothetical protein
MRFNFQSLAYLFIAGLIGFTSCKKDEETKPAPTITINSTSITIGSNPASGTANPGDVVSITATFEASEKLKSIQAFTVSGSTDTKIDDISSDFDSDIKHQEIWNITIPATATGSITYKFVVTDKSNGTSSRTFVVNIGDLSSWSAKLLGAQDNAAGSYFASSTGEVFKGADAPGKVNIVDVTYAALGASAAPTLLSYKFRGDASTGLTVVPPAGALETKFALTSLTPAQFIATGSSSEANFTAGAATVGSNQSVAIAAGKVYAFVSGTKKGLIHVASLTPGLAGSVNIDVKVQK